MSHEDENRKRVSLRGRGWQILRGQDASTETQGESLTPDESADLLSASPPPLGMLPQSPATGQSTVELSQEELETAFFQEADQEEGPGLTAQAFDELLSTSQFTETPPTPTDTLEAAIIDELDMDDGVSIGDPAFASLLSTTDFATPPPLPENALESAFLQEANANDNASEAIPSLESAEALAIAVDLSGSVNSQSLAQQSIIPTKPETVPTQPSQPTLAQVDVSATTVPYGGQEGIPLVEDFDHPAAVDLHGAPFSKNDKLADIIPQSPEKALTNEPYDRGGIFVPEVEVATGEDADDSILLAPFTSSARVSSKELFPTTQTADPNILERFVDEGRLADLWFTIERLQEDMVDNPALDRDRADIYQQELLQASEMLLQSRDNYDDARAITYRVRTDVSRDLRTTEAIRKYSPQLLGYLLIWGIALICLGLLKGFVGDVAENADARFFGAAYLPTIFGAAGGLFLAYSTLIKHTTTRRDFDPIHIPWYLLCPVIGGLMGFLTFLLLLATLSTAVTQDLTDPKTLESWPVLVWLLAFYAGIQQNWVIKWLRALRGRVDSD
ncbi:MAG: hypothetical protein H6673_08825 [Anaerolineales bacterium]|nr:hypothetical protein [Anaerolineales bacterium]